MAFRRQVTGDESPSVSGDENPPTAQATVTTRQPRLPLGVHEGQSVPRGPRFEGRLPAAFANRYKQATYSRYYSGDEWRPLNMPSSVPTLQAQLVAAGLLDVDSVRPGWWDEKSAAAYKNVLETANREGLTAAQALSLLGANPTLGQQRASGGGGGGRSVTLANPQDLQAVANEVAPKVIGRRLDQNELSKFVAGFQGAQRGGGNPPSMDVAAEAYAREAAPTEATARDMVGVFDVALNMMRGRASSG